MCIFFRSIKSTGCTPATRGYNIVGGRENGRIFCVKKKKKTKKCCAKNNNNKHHNIYKLVEYAQKENNNYALKRGRTEREQPYLDHKKSTFYYYYYSEQEINQPIQGNKPVFFSIPRFLF